MTSIVFPFTPPFPRPGLGLLPIPTDQEILPSCVRCCRSLPQGLLIVMAGGATYHDACCPPDEFENGGYYTTSQPIPLA